ncbi:39848_t:CDS:2, partial [Gigaspora margarita]
MACQSFQKKFVNGLCKLCGFLLKYNLSSHIPNTQYQQPTSESSLKSNIIDSILIEFFEFEKYYENQQESILSFLSGHDILTILKTGGGKSLIYAAASVLYRGLTVVFTPQKALIDDQVREIVGMGISAAILYASSEQPPLVQEKIFAEIASGLIRVLFITPEKYTENLKFCTMLQNVYNIRGLQFVIDEVHCVVLYKGFWNAWKNLGILKHDFPTVPVLALTATCSFIDTKIIQSALERPDMKIIRNSTIHRSEIILEVRPKPATKDKLYQAIFNLLDNLEGRAIIYGATVKECDNMTKALCKNFDPTIVGIYHGKLTSAKQTAISAGWKNGTIKIMYATTAFGMGINVDNIILVIHTTLSMSHKQYIQEIGRAGRAGQESKAILFYSRGDICTLLSILNGGQVSNSVESQNLSHQFTTINTIEEKKAKIKAMMLYADAIYECRQQLAYYSFLWPNNTQIPEYHICDDCKEREKDAPDMYVVDVFYGSKNNNEAKKNLAYISEYPRYIQTRLHPKKMCFYLLDSLIQKEIIIQVVDLQRIRPESSILTCSYKILE